MEIVNLRTDSLTCLYRSYRGISVKLWQIYKQFKTSYSIFNLCFCLLFCAVETKLNHNKSIPNPKLLLLSKPLTVQLFQVPLQILKLLSLLLIFNIVLLHLCSWTFSHTSSNRRYAWLNTNTYHSECVVSTDVTHHEGWNYEQNLELWVPEEGPAQQERITHRRDKWIPCPPIAKCC